MANADIQRARRLRRDATDAEKLLWARLRAAPWPIRVRRQHPVEGYIADFAFVPARLIIELDGGQHLEQQAYDNERTQFLQAQGYRVLRFWNKDVLSDLNGVMKVILDALSPVSEL